MMKCQHYVRQHMRDLMLIFDKEDEEERKKAFVPKVAAVSSKDMSVSASKDMFHFVCVKERLCLSVMSMKFDMDQ